MPESAELTREPVHGIFRKWTRTDQTEVPRKYVPELRQFVETRLSQQRAHSRDHPGIGLQFEKSLPVLALTWMSGQVRVERTIRIRVHGPEFPNPNPFSAG